MTKEENRAFVKKSESLIKPRDITAISFLGDFNKYLPKKVQHKIMQKGSSMIPYMGFVVDPYCFFVSYKITDRAAAQAMLPDGYELTETSVFNKKEKHPLVIISAFTARTSAFTGMRLECYIIARNIKTGLLSWIIADYETNTNSHDPRNGFCGYTSDPAVFATTPYGELLVDVKGSVSKREFSAKVDLNAGKTEKLEESLWVEGNMSVDYGGELKHESSVPFSLIFDPVLMKEALRIPLKSIDIEKNSFMDTIINSEQPVDAAVFPYSQHFIIRQDLREESITSEKDLFYQIKTFLDRSGFKTMSGDDIKKPLFRGMIISTLVNIAIILFLLIQWLF
ncbi:MAG: hypothetical protein JW904_05810 [Spirochaetales bacterium]|nr:hypothetical protein [Spirochaetales bacterium]